MYVKTVETQVETFLLKNILAWMAFKYRYTHYKNNNFIHFNKK